LRRDESRKSQQFPKRGEFKQFVPLRLSSRHPTRSNRSPSNSPEKDLAAGNRLTSKVHQVDHEMKDIINLEVNTSHVRTFEMENED